MSLEPAARLDPCCGCAKSAGFSSSWASLGTAASTAARVMPQRASRHTGGGVGTGVGVGAASVVGGRVVVVVAWATGGGASFFVHDTTSRGTASTARRRGVLMALLV